MENQQPEALDAARLEYLITSEARVVCEHNDYWLEWIVENTERQGPMFFSPRAAIDAAIAAAKDSV